MFPAAGSFTKLATTLLWEAEASDQPWELAVLLCKFWRVFQLSAPFCVSHGAG